MPDAEGGNVKKNEDEVQVEVTFVTVGSRTVSQDQAREFWGAGTDFKATTSHTYEWKVTYQQDSRIFPDRFVTEALDTIHSILGMGVFVTSISLKREL